MAKQLESATEVTLSMVEKVYTSNKISLDVLRQLKEAENEISSL